MKIYLDACCINRPFDDQSQARIRLEAESVLLILRRFEMKEWTWYGSTVLNYELNQIPDAERRQRVRLLIRQVDAVVAPDSRIAARAQQLEMLGFKAFDALHAACAEKAGVDVLLTTDDRFLRLAERFSDQVRIRIENPLIWLNEVMRK